MKTKTNLEVFMEDEKKQQRIFAVQRFNMGESPEAICTSLGKSRSWLYKWIGRYLENDDSWSDSHSRRPLSVSRYTPTEVEEIVKMVRLNLYNQDLFCGAQAIHWEMEELGVKPLPSTRTINRVLSRNDLTHRRTGKYEAKGTAYPKLPSLLPNQTHQADLVGPCYLKGPVRFYSLNVVDTATVRCGLHPSQDNPSLTASGPSGHAWGYQIASRLITPCPSLEALRIPVAWVLSSGCACIMTLNPGSSQCLSLGEMG